MANGIVYDRDEDGVIWLRMPDLIRALRPIRFGQENIGNKIADGIELVVYRDINKGK